MAESEAILRLMIIARTGAALQEMRDACRGVLGSNVNLFVAQDLTRAIEMARDREPQIALVELSGNLEEDRNNIRELRAVVPETMLVGVFDAEVVDEVSGGSANSLVELVRLGVRDFLRRPIPGTELRQLFDRVQVAKPIAATFGTCISFISNKGGVGKSSLAVNTATRLAQRHPDEVLLIDASLQMGVCAPMLNLQPGTTILDAIRQRDRLDGTLLRQLAVTHESGLSLLASPPDAISATEINDQMMTRLLNLARRSFKYVVVDTFPMFDQIVMSILDVSTLSFIVLDNVVPTVVSAMQLVKLLDSLQFAPERTRVVVNRFQRVMGNPLIDDVARSLQREVDFVIPYDNRAITAANIGRPFAMNFMRWSKLHRGLEAIVQEVEAVENLERTSTPATRPSVRPLQVLNEADSAQDEELAIDHE